MRSNSKHLNKVTIASLLIALGIIYGDIGTSPLYVLNAIVAGRVINDELILGSLSCIIWTLTLQTTVKLRLSMILAIGSIGLVYSSSISVLVSCCICCVCSSFFLVQFSLVGILFCLLIRQFIYFLLCK